MSNDGQFCLLLAVSFRGFLDTHIFDLSVGSGRLKLKEDDVEDRHLEGSLMIEKSFEYWLVSSQIFSICIPLSPYREWRLVWLFLCFSG